MCSWRVEISPPSPNWANERFLRGAPPFVGCCGVASEPVVQRCEGAMYVRCVTDGEDKGRGNVGRPTPPGLPRQQPGCHIFGVIIDRVLVPNALVGIRDSMITV